MPLGSSLKCMAMQIEEGDKLLLQLFLASSDNPCMAKMWSYHAWDVGFASHKINSFSSLSTLCLGCLRIVGWLHLKAPLESFPNLSILNQESDYLHTANKKSETNFWRKMIPLLPLYCWKASPESPSWQFIPLESFLGNPVVDSSVNEDQHIHANLNQKIADRVGHRFIKEL